ncbi:MAG: NAD/NADP octopine/nopaline dehydrogenase family protein [Akkermansia sp.]|nr:NAD/NADP octopine/nopaline dehydrogenase family protein [Akkermansia sp.]
MADVLNITLCGGGNLTHAQAAYLARKGHRVHVYTRRPQQWGNKLSSYFFDGDSREVQLASVSSCPEIVSDSDVVIISLPRYAIAGVTEQIYPYLSKDALLVYAPGMPALLNMEKEHRWYNKKLCALYKVPFISRTEIYGHSVSVLGSRDINRVWYAHEDMECYTPLLEELFDTPLVQLSSAYPFLLTNSNPLLHPSRLVDLFRNYEKGVYYPRNFFFYEEWTDASSELYIQADEELLKICEKCSGMTIGKDIIPVKEYYESLTVKALTQKINSITAFKGILSPMKQVSKGWVPNFESRYFTEDIAWGTKPICDYAREVGVDTPTLDYFVKWTESMIRANEH